MTNYLVLARKLINVLTKNDLLLSINRGDDIFFDEPQKFTYIAQINENSSYLKKKGYKIYTGAKPHNLLLENKVTGSGYSFQSRELALLKCLSELIERLSMYCFNNSDLIVSSYVNLQQDALNPKIFLSKNNIENLNFRWKKGVNVNTSKEILLPAQLLYLNYKRGKDEIRLTSPISTGAASGFGHEETLLRAIYEVVERDAFMTVYLNKISPPLIDLYSIDSTLVDKILDQLKRFNLIAKVIDLTNDLKIPSFLTILIDPTGIGPSLTLGLKSDLNSIRALEGSLEESFLLRSWLRYEVITKGLKTNIDSTKIYSLLDRGMLWYPLHMIKKIKFIYSSKITKKIENNKVIKPKQALLKILTRVRENRLNLFYSDISLPIFKKVGHLTYKAILPDLQPLYLDEINKKLNLKRLRTVANFFGKRKHILYNFPHPFL